MHIYSPAPSQRSPQEEKVCTHAYVCHGTLQNGAERKGILLLTFNHKERPSCYRKKICFCSIILYKKMKLFCATLKFPGYWFQLIQGSTWPKVNIISLERYVEICVLSEELWLCSPHPMPLSARRPECLNTNIPGQLLSIENHQAGGIHVSLRPHMITHLVLKELLIKSPVHLLHLFKMIRNNSKYPSTCREMSGHLPTF